MNPDNRPLAAVAGLALAALAVFGLGVWVASDADASRLVSAGRWPPSPEGFWAGRPGSPEAYRSICDRPLDNIQADLCQQWRSAERAGEIAWYTKLQLVLAGLGTAGLLSTLYYSRKATQAAADAVEAANDQMAATEKFSRAQLRAYISVEPRGIRALTRRTDQAVGWVGIRNVGQTPARNVSVSVHLHYFDSKRLGLEAFPSDVLSPATDRVVQPSAELLMGSQDEVSLSQYAANRADGYIFVWGVVTYDDGFGKERYTAFCHRYNTASRSQDDNPGIKPNRARYHEVGNDAS